MKIGELLAESLATIDEDVNWIYDKFFRADIEELSRTGIITFFMFGEQEISSADLKTELCKQAHRENPVRILINSDSSGGNLYSPTLQYVSITVNWNAANYARHHFNGDVREAHANLAGRQKEMFNTEFTEERIKGTIHHELAHWVDDSLHAKHIQKRIDWATKNKKRDLSKKVPINLDPIEIHAQIHNIYQLKNKFPEKWDSMTFDDMISYVPSLMIISSELSPDHLKEWKKLLKKRMHREGLLGKRMK